MQVFGLQAAIYRGARLASRLSAQTPDIVALRRDALRRFREGRRAGLSAEAAARVVGVGRATLYRWTKRCEPKSRRPWRLRTPAWPSKLVRAVEHWRQEEPCWGRAKILIKLKAEGFTVSASTVGRILKKLIARGVVGYVADLRKKRGGSVRWTRKRRFAVRLPKGMKAKAPGRLIQIDTVYVNTGPEKTIKHFTAYDPVAKWTVGKAFNRATAASAKSFLDTVIQRMPFPVKGIQVDGGSEFMADFEKACEDRKLDLYVLPPRSPKLNGAVERCNGAWRYEFYAIYELPRQLERLNPLIEAFEHRYNHHRPHQALDGLTPAQHLQKLLAAQAPASQMC
jgi:putative transposase